MGVASIAPIAASAEPAAAIPVAEHCRSWLAIDAEIDRLSERWAALSDRGASAAAECEQVEAQLERLRHVQADRLEQIAGAEARDLQAVASKLAVLACLTREDGGPVHEIVTEALGLLQRRPLG
ncbi:hypothetical protein [Caulobacter endophyticus]|uniref:hypothetical protein n=1 Tax=Caulobacter endophyticus TaxID=2172652 RepID=UPI0024100305|nr:hypothetical protein [Caulobacter endophyticus]MDG2531276.1 hypothetical protein [Caulobacter endophyticus]